MNSLKLLGWKVTLHMPRLTHKEYLNKFNNLVTNNEYTLESTYTSSRDYVTIKHNNCGYTWRVLAGNAIRKGKGPRCPKCSKIVSNKKSALTHRKKFNPNVFYDYVFSIVGNEYTFLDKYVNMHTKMEVVHNICGLHYFVTPTTFKRGRRCPNCSHKLAAKSRAKSDEEFKNEVLNLGNGHYVVVSKYTTWNHKVKMFHKDCGSFYEVEPNSFLQGRRCPNCKSSHGENFIKSYLEKRKIRYEQQVKFLDLKDKRHLSYDFYLSDRDILIEYQGKQHYFPVSRYGGEDHLKLQRRHDMLKYNYAIDNGIDILYVDYTKDTMHKVFTYLDGLL